MGHVGGGMGRVKDYMMQSGGDRLGRLCFKALDSRGQGHPVWSAAYVLAAIARIWASAALGQAALVHVNVAERLSLVRKTLVILCARMAGLPVVLHLHAAEIVRLYRTASPLMRWFMRIPFRYATCCVVLGKLWRDWLVHEVGIDADKVAIVYNGVPADRLPKADTPFTFLFLGNLTERKGLTDFLHALSLLPRSGDWQAVVAGGGDIERYRKIADGLGISSHVRFTGWVAIADASALLCEASALVLPSFEEGLPLVILEALGRGTPVIATPVGAIPEVLEDRRTVLFVAPGNRSEIAERMQELMSDSELRRTLAENGRALYDERFTVKCFLDNLFLVYRRYCGLEIERASGKTSLFEGLAKRKI